MTVAPQWDPRIITAVTTEAPVDVTIAIHEIMAHDQDMGPTRGAPGHMEALIMDDQRPIPVAITKDTRLNVTQSHERHPATAVTRHQRISHASPPVLAMAIPPRTEAPPAETAVNPARAAMEYPTVTAQTGRHVQTPTRARRHVTTAVITVPGQPRSPGPRAQTLA